MASPLRLVLVIDDLREPPPWCIRLIEAIGAEPNIDLAGLVCSASVRAPGHVNTLAQAFARFWAGLETRLAARPQAADRDAYARAVKAIPAATFADSGSIQALDADVILDLTSGLGTRIEPGLARQGVWHADFLHPAAELASLAHWAPTIRIALFRRTAQEPAPIGIAVAALNTKSIASRNALFMREKAVPLILRALRRTSALGCPDKIEGLVEWKPTGPGWGELLRYASRLAPYLVRHATDILLEKAGSRPGMFFLKSATGSWTNFDPAAASAHVSGKNSYFADPFLWQRDGRTYCFFEEYDYITGLGHIAVGLMDNGTLSDVAVALQTEYHLSFPFLFEHEGSLFMLPETSAVRRLEVWKCVEFPHRWERHATAMEGVAASDSSLNLIDGTWWLFTNISRDPFLDMNSELHVFRVDGPDLARIEPHAFNPVVFDTYRARNAGRILRIDGRLCRPAQENSHGTYGFGLRLMEIGKLSLDEYEEVEVGAISPDFEPGLIGCHHLDIRGDQVIIDARKRIGGRVAEHV